MGMSSSGGGDELNSEINVTPMVDIMLVLLIIFMITAPMMNHGVDITLPKVSAKAMEDPEGKLKLRIDKQQRVYIGETAVTWKTLQAKLAANERLKAEKELYIDADAGLPYGVIVTAMAVAKNAGIEKVMMVTEPANGNSTETELDLLDKNAAAAPPPPASGAAP
jgi:biopolymer transport protein TolR